MRDSYLACLEKVGEIALLKHPVGSTVDWVSDAAPCKYSFRVTPVPANSRSLLIDPREELPPRLGTNIPDLNAKNIEFRAFLTQRLVSKGRT